jgi:hypothetical protein
MAGWDAHVRHSLWRCKWDAEGGELPHWIRALGAWSFLVTAQLPQPTPGTEMATCYISHVIVILLFWMDRRRQVARASNFTSRRS